MDLKRAAARIMHCGRNKIWIDPLRVKEVEEAITMADVRRLIQRGIIKKSVTKGRSRAGARHILTQKKKGRRKGRGSRKGLTLGKKVEWMRTIRAIRAELKRLRDTGSISTSSYRRLYRQAKGGLFKSKSSLRASIRKSGLYVKKEKGR
jgi:large subunit ribosomal protein L19e